MPGGQRPLTNGYGQWLTGIVRELSRHHDVRLIGGYRMATQDGPPSVEADLRIVPFRASLRKRRGMWQRRRAAVLHVDLDRGLEPLAVPDGYPSVW